MEYFEQEEMMLNIRAGTYLTDCLATLELLKEYLDGRISRVEIESNLTLQLNYDTSLVETIELSTLMSDEMDNFFTSKYTEEQLNEVIGIFAVLEGLIYQSTSYNALVLNKKFYGIISDMYRNLKKLDDELTLKES